MANINELTPREFEVLAANYARSIFPDYNWKITKAVGDYNRDFEAVVDDLSKWENTLLRSTEEKRPGLILWLLSKESFIKFVESTPMKK